MPLTQLSSKRAGRELRWTAGGGLSVRAYAHDRLASDCPCVSTRSAELTVVLDGTVEIEVGPSRQVVRIEHGEACWLPRGMPHAVRVLAQARALVVDRTDAGPDTLRHLPRASAPGRLMREIDRAWARGAREALATVAASGDELRARLASREPIAIEETPTTRKMHAVKRAIEERFASPPSLADLAGRIGTSEFYLLRSFKRHFAFTPFAYAQFLRTEHFFWELLGAPSRREPREGRTLLALSADAGWGDYSTFERRIRAIAGRPPSDLLTHDPSATLGPR